MVTTLSDDLAHFKRSGPVISNGGGAADGSVSAEAHSELTQQVRPWCVVCIHM